MEENLILNLECLIAFTNAGKLDVLRKIYKKFEITPEVKKKYEKKGFVLPGWIKVKEPSDKERASYFKKRFGLRNGESIALAYEEKNFEIVLDDSRLDEDVYIPSCNKVITLGIINWALRENIITSDEAAVIMEKHPLEILKKKNNAIAEKNRLPNPSSEPKIVKWMEWQAANYKVHIGKYKDCYDDLKKTDIKKIENCIYKYFLDKGDFLRKKCFNGHYHQNMPKGAPIIEYKGLLYAYIVSTRKWGNVVARVMAKLNNKKFIPKEQIEKELGDRTKEKILEGIDENSYYCYLNFAWTWDE